MTFVSPRAGAFVLYQAIVWTLLLLPFDFHWPRSLLQTLGVQMLHFEDDPRAFVIEVIKSATHAALLFPLAPILSWSRAEPLRRIFHWRLVVLVALVCALSEIIQLTVNRGASLPDFLMDLCGFLLGLLAVRLHRRIAAVRAIVLRLTAAWVAAAAILAVSVVIWRLQAPADGFPFGPRGLSAWDSTLPLNLASERTGSRPWSGEVASISLRAGGGGGGGGPELLRYDLVPASLELDAAGGVAAIKGLGPDLRAASGAKALPSSSGVEIRAPTLFTTLSALAGVVDAIREAGVFSVAVRVRPSDLDQSGPARILTCSATNRIRNFTLSQVRDGLEFRVRTPITGPDAALGGVLRVPNCLKSDTTVDIQASYSAGSLRLWVAGELRGVKQVTYLDWLSHQGFGSPCNRRVLHGLAAAAWGLLAALFWLLLARRGARHRHAMPLGAFAAALWLWSTLALARWPVAWAEDWPAWRGAAGVGISAEQGIATRWSPKEGVRWSFDDPGKGHSSPIVSRGALFLTTADKEVRLLIRLDAATGREAWRREVLETELERKHAKNSHASSTPAADGEHVFVTFLDGKRVVAAAYDFDGKERWRVSPGEFHSMHGFCASPLLHQDLVILNCDQDADAYLVALDKATGKERWRADRPNKVRSYCPPTVFDVGGKPQMVLSGSKTVSSYDPRTGKRLWVCDGPTEQCVASLVYGDGLVFVTGGYPDRHFLAIDPTGTGDVTSTHIRWRASKQVSYVPSPLYHQGHFYCVSDLGVLSALDARTGEYRSSRRLRGNFSASLLYAAGHIYAASEEGDVFVLKASPELDTVSEIAMGDPIYATPVVSGGVLYLRTWKRLYAIGK